MPTPSLETEQHPTTELQQWDNLVSSLDLEMLCYGPIRRQMGRILYEMKVHLKKHGLDTGRGGRWKPLLDARKIAVSTANDWVRQYEEEAGIPVPERFFAPAKARKDKKKSADSVLLPDSDAEIVPSDEPDKQGREAVEAIFVLTAPEKLAFISAVKELGPARATQLMYSAVVGAAKGVGA